MMQDNKAYTDGEPYIFVSYSNKDTESVATDIKRMISAGYKVKFNNIFNEEDHNTQTFNNISSSKQFVVYLSETFNNEKSLKKQIDFALANKIPIIIVYIRNVILNGYYDILFSSVRSIEKYSLNYNDYFRKLASVLDSECMKFISQSPTENRRKNFVVHINYDEDNVPYEEECEETKQIETEIFKKDYREQSKKAIKKPNENLKPLFISASAILLIVIAAVSVLLIGNYISQKNYNTALAYYNGDSGNKDYKQAYDYFLKSANSGNADAMFYVGKMYQNGQEVVKDNKQSYNWYSKSAEKGNALAEQSLGDMLFAGVGVTQNYSKAYSWYSKAASQNNAVAQEKLGEMYLNGYFVTKNYEQAKNYFTLSANSGNSDAELNLGYLYDKGFGVAQNYNTALDFYTKAANQNNAQAMANTGILYDNGYGVKQDYNQAYNWYKKASAKNNADADLNLGNLYLSGHGVKQNNFTAADFYVKACKEGSKDAPNKLKNMYESGCYFNYTDLGDMYYYGWGVNKNLSNAKKWYQQGAANKNSYCISMIKNGKFS